MYFLAIFFFWDFYFSIQFFNVIVFKNVIYINQGHIQASTLFPLALLIEHYVNFKDWPVSLFASLYWYMFIPCRIFLRPFFIFPSLLSIFVNLQVSNLHSNLDFFLHSKCLYILFHLSAISLHLLLLAFFCLDLVFHFFYF